MECETTIQWAVREIAAARREGVIEGLGRALELALTPMPHDPALVKLIRTEIERLRAEQKVG